MSVLEFVLNVKRLVLIVRFWMELLPVLWMEISVFVKLVMILTSCKIMENV